MSSEDQKPVPRRMRETALEVSEAWTQVALSIHGAGEPQETVQRLRTAARAMEQFADAMAEYYQ